MVLVPPLVARIDTILLHNTNFPADLLAKGEPCSLIVVDTEIYVFSFTYPYHRLQLLAPPPPLPSLYLIFVPSLILSLIFSHFLCKFKVKALD